MRKILIGLVAAAAIAAPFVAATSANAATTTSAVADCVPVIEVSAASAVTHVEYKYVGAGSTKWSRDSNPILVVDGVTYTAENYANGALKGQHKTQIVIETPAVQAVDGVNCEIPLPANPLTGLNGIGPNTVVPTPAGTAKYTFDAVNNHVALNGKIGTTVRTTPGYVFPGGLTSKVFAATPDNTNFIFLNGAGTTTKTVNLPDVFVDTRTFDGATYAFVQVTRTIVNESENDLVVGVMAADQQDDNQIWIERTVFENWRHDIVIPAHSSKTVAFDVWYDVANYGSDVPDDLTLDFSVNAL